MLAKQTTVQSPRPEVKIYAPMSDKPKLQFDYLNWKGLQSYSFKTSVDDAKGNFSLTFHPDQAGSDTPIFDQIKILDIVEIYESKNHFKKSSPTYIGVIRSKKYASQIGGTSVNRKLVITGHSVVGLAAEFCMNMDTSAQVITDTLAAQENISKSLTTSLLEGNEPLKLEEVIKKIWDEFVKLSTQYGKLSNPAIYKILSKWSRDFFDIDKKITLNYPLGCVFDAKSTKGFFDLVESIIPHQVYEKFAYMDRVSGKMRLKIRECPFDYDQWVKLKNHDCYEIPLRLVKSVDVEQNDNEVYTVFFSYLDGYPIQQLKAIVLGKQNQDSKNEPALVHDDKKYSLYGYRPLFVTFIGYSKDEGDEDTTTEEKLQKLNQRLMNWYGNMELMYSGQLTLSIDLSMDMPQAGETIAFLGGEFYVTSAEHKWNYKGNPETVLAISRGGNYTSKSFKELKYWGRNYTGGKV